MSLHHRKHQMSSDTQYAGKSCARAGMCTLTPRKPHSDDGGQEDDEAADDESTSTSSDQCLG
jgi:hypothetical protein